jgi:Uma2 family endonuclease
VKWQERSLEVYRREEGMLKLVATLYENDTLQSPHLPGFTCQLNKLFAHIR